MVLSRRIAVIGGGLSGLACARRLSEAFGCVCVGHGYKRSRRPSVNQESRWVSIRLRLPIFPGSNTTNARSFERASGGRGGSTMAGTGREAAVQSASLIPKGDDVSPGGAFCGALLPGDLYVGVPAMGALVDYLASPRPSLQTRWAERVEELQRGDDQLWHVVVAAAKGSSAAPASDSGAGFDAVVLSDLMTLQPGSPGYLGLQNQGIYFPELQSVENVPLFSMMAAVPSPLLQVPFDAAAVEGNAALQWISRDSSKPGREREDGAECWVAVTTEEYARQLIEDSGMLVEGGKYKPLSGDQQSLVALRLWHAFLDALQIYVPDKDLQPSALAVQRWGSGLKTGLAPKLYEFDSHNNLLVCGDVFSESTAEGAVVSGLAAAEALVEYFS
eukprot:jgi/Botrbrau1/16892/Bobra.150_2s0105.1